MSWSVNLRVLGLCGVLLAALPACGGNPELPPDPNPGTDGGSSGSGGNGAVGGNGAGGIVFMPMGGTENGTGGTEVQNNYVCGNKQLEPGEFCDDGNTDDDDGCSGDCSMVDLDFDCSKVGEPCIKVVICGNGVLEGDEMCDDMNTTAGDGCPADCSVAEDGWVCIRPGEACVQISVCGNGARERGEACDDGVIPPVSDDGCDDLCQIEPSYFCPIPGQPCVKQVCGDGVQTPGEVCDDDNTMAGDGCAADCKSIEQGWHCNAMGCKPECGDGLVRGAEQCDDNGAIGGDGCSSGCKVEPFFKCDSSMPSKCGPALTKLEACGNGKLDPIFTGNIITDFEVCDPPNVDGCNGTCDAFIPQTSDPAVCGNGVVEAGEACDRPAADPGCSAMCAVETGYSCPPVGACVLKPKCNDGTVDFALGEECDPPKVGMGCSAQCKVESGWNCTGLGPSLCVKPVCGNGVVDPKTATTAAEQCDDGNNIADDGCTSCVLSPDYVCPAAGQPCQPRCGDGKKVGIEQCDDGNKTSEDGCNAGCKIEPGYKCPTPGATCVESTCGDDNDDTGEGCDDGNNIAGDGCGPTCQKEPTVTVGPDPVVNVSCGDGIKTGAEACDDGNTADGDGCQKNCTIPAGWTCNSQLDLPTSLQMRVTYRDFRSAPAEKGHPDFQYDNLGHVPGIVGAQCKSANAATCGRLDANGKPLLIKTTDQATTGIRDQASFRLWYRDGNPSNTTGFHGIIDTKTTVDTLTLNQTGGATSETYVFDSGDNNFYPLQGAKGLGNIGDEGIGCGANGLKNQVDAECFCTGGECKPRDYGFTTELRYFFQYKGGETLIFSGDDDVWVFVNGKLALDIGGLHPRFVGQIVLGDDGNGNAGEDSSCSPYLNDTNDNDPPALPNPTGGCYTNGEKGDNTDARYGLTKGNVYEIVLFHAERHVDASNFKLTLAGFLAPRSFCESKCGDGILVGDEFCDEGGNNSDTVAGACRKDCTSRNFCGDKAIQSPEQCDDGQNITTYKTAQTPVGACAPGCKTPPSCGDGTQQSGQGEQCDNGGANSDTSYGDGSCKKNCTLGNYCGDGATQTGNGEVCDLGPDNGQTYGTSSCTYDCQPGPRCGDGVLAKGFEACDKGAANGTPDAHCNANCTIPAYCGDGKLQMGEECDYGQFASTEYGGCTDMCVFGPHCGDGGPGNTPDPEEECDYGTASNDGSYDGCTNKCGLGPRCGDGVLQANEGEACDNGFNADDYDDPKTPQAECGMNCSKPPTCGDGVLQPAYELCDYGALDSQSGTCADDQCNYPADSAEAYQGCTTLCEFGPYCGDGMKQSSEACDNGLQNVSYAAQMGGCGYDCQMAPYCGDATRNGPEQCDLGTDKNTGAYGTCNEDCTFGPRCGDGEEQDGEECDDGPIGSLSCTPTCKRRIQVQ